MSDVVDISVAKLGFDNREFINNVNMSIMAVDALKDSLNFDSKSFDSLTKAANNIDLSSIATNVESLSQRFSTFGIVGMTAIQRITNELMTLGGKLVGLLAKPWKQIISGGWSRASNIGQAKFQLEGLFGKSEEGAAKLNMTMMATSEQIAQLAEESQGFSADMIVAMNAADYAVADTAYGLDSAAKAASVLATSGVDVVHFSEDLKDSSGLMRTEMQVALRGISGVAAMANREYDDVARVFERVSGAGRVMGDDLNSLASYGLNAAATLRDYMNELDSSIHLTESDIREMVTKGQIDFMTFAKAMDSAYGDHAKDANNTFSGAFSNMKFALSKIGADFISPIRNKMVPLFNDIRISINQVRKALNFKIKFPGLEEEISLVELFTRVITNLTAKAHDLFTVWHGGQNVMEQAMAGFANASGASFERIKAVFDRVTAGSRTSAQGINELTDIARFNGLDLTDVYKQLGETFDKTESEIVDMCRNGEISFEDFYKAMSAVFGNDIQDTRISQLASIIGNLVKGFWNLARTVSGIVGPVIYAFFQVFNTGGVKGIMGITQAFAEFTQTLVTSRETQEKIRSLAFSLFSILKSGIKVVLRVASAIIKIAQALAPLIIQVLEFADVIASVISYVVDIIVESRLLNSIIAVLTKAIQVAGYVIINVFRIILGIVGPVIKAVGEVFAFLARSIGSIDISFIDILLDAFKRLADTIANGGIVNTLVTAVQILFLGIGRVFKNFTLSFEVVCDFLENVADRIASICDRIATIFTNMKVRIQSVFTALWNFVDWIAEDPRRIISLVAQLTSLTILFRFAQTMRGIGRTFSGLGNVLNSNAISVFVSSIKQLAQAVLEFAIAIVLLSSIPTANVQTTVNLLWNLTAALASLLSIYVTYMIVITAINNSIKGDPLIKFLNKLSNSINVFLRGIARAANIAAFAVLLIGLAASIAILFGSVKKFAALNYEEFETGLVRIGYVVTLLAGFITLLAVASGQHIGGKASISNSVVLGNGGLMGAALTLMALIIVLREFKQLILDYDAIGIDENSWSVAFLRIMGVMFMLASAIATLGLTVKQAGFGLMGSVSAMMGFLTVLEGFVDIMRAYAALFDGPDAIDTNAITQALILIFTLIFTVTSAIVAMAYAMSEGSSKFNASLKGGLSFESNSAKFLGIVLTMLSLCLVIETLVSSMKLLGGDEEARKTADLVFNLLVIILGGLATITFFMKDVKAGSVFGLGVILMVLSAVLPLLAGFEWNRILVAAGSLSLVIGALAALMQSLGAVEVTALKGFGVISLITLVIIELAAVFTWLGLIPDPAKMAASGAAIAATLVAFGAAFKLMGGTAFNAGAIMQMVIMLPLLGLILEFFNHFITPADPSKMLAIVTAVSILSVVMGIVARLLNGVVIVNGVGLIESLIGIAVSMGILMVSMVQAANYLTGDIKNVGLIAVFVNALIPIMLAIGMLATVMSKLQTTWSGIGMVAIVISLVVGLIGAITMAASLGDAEGTVKIMKGIEKSVLGMIGLIGAISAISIIFGLLSSTGILAGGLLAGIGLMGLMLTELALFIGGIAASATLGDADATVVLLGGLGTSLDAMVPFLLKMGAICTLFGVVSPLLAAGSIGFGVLLTVIAAFVGMIAFVATMGNPEDTVTLLLGLTKAMDRFNEFLGHFMIVLTLLGAVAPLAAVGAMVFKAILDILSRFALSMSVIGATGNASSTVTVMRALTDSMRELVDTFLIIMVLGAMAIPVIAGMLMITTAMGLLLGVSYIIGQIDAIKNTIVSGIATILLSAESLALTTTVMSGIDLGAIMQFIFAMALISATPMTGISKFAFIATTMTMLGVSSSLILKGSKTTVEMFKDLYASVELMNAITRTNTKGLVNVTDDILKSAINLANVGKYIGVWVPYSIADGVLSNSGLETLATAGYLMAKVLEESIRNTMQIHSFSPLYGGIGGWAPESMGIGFTNNLSSLMNAGSDGMADFGGMMNNLAGQYGNQAGVSYAEQMGQTIWEFLEYAGEGYKDLINYFGGDVVEFMYGDMAGDAWRQGHDVKTLASNNNDLAESIENVDTATQNLINNNGTRPYFSPNLVVEKDTASSVMDDLESQMQDFTDWSWLTKDFGDVFNLGSIGDSISDAFGGLDEDATSASKSVDQLTNKIDDLMDKYENLWEDAKERANKDLFKGVDKQGDDFLDSVQDIMDKFKNIYQDAVEKTNGQDLFAEVKDEEESFAPETLLNNLEDQVNQVNELNTIIGSLGGRIADNGLRAAISAMDVDNLPELRALYRMDDAQLREYESMYQKKVQANQNKIQNELTGSLSQLTGQYTDVATYVATDASTNALVRNLQSQIDQLNEYNSTVSSLTGRIKDVNLREAIAHMGVDSIEELKALNRMTDAQLDEYTEMYRRKVDEEAQVIKNELSTELSTLLNEPVDISEFYLSYRGQLIDATTEVADKAGQAAGTTIGKATAKGAESKDVLVVAKNSSAKIVNEIGDGLTDEEGLQKIESNIKMILDNIVTWFGEANEEFKKIGTTIVEKICAGIDLGRRNANFTNTLTDFKMAIANALTVGYEVRWNMVGEYITNGIAKGILADRAVNNLTNAAKIVALKAAAAAREELKIKSPSRVFMEIGRYIDEGLAIGLKDYAGLAEDEAGTMAEGSISAVQDAIQQLSGMLDGTIDLNPVITPSLDLSEINARSSALANMFTGRRIAVQAQVDQQAETMSQLSDILAEQNSEPRTITFNQTNNSPKALSRTEIYRQTRNGFSQLASAIQ